MSPASLAFAFVAGLFTTLSPCVIPVLPFVTASSVAKNRLGPVALASGLLITFVFITLIVSRTGAIFGIDQSIVRRSSGAFLAVAGLLFLSSKLSERFASSLSGLTGKAASLSQKNFGGPLATEFVVGLLLGIVWTPCSGPSLGVALGLAAQEGSLGPAFFVLSLFGLGAVIPLILFAYGARRLLGKLREHSGIIGGFKKAFGALMVLFGALVLLDWDRYVERFFTGALPDFWVEFITRL